MISDCQAPASEAKTIDDLSDGGTGMSPTGIMQPVRAGVLAPLALSVVPPLLAGLPRKSTDTC